MSLIYTNRKKPEDGKYNIGPFVLTEQQLANVFNQNVVENVTAAKQLVPSDSGKTFLLKLATGFTVTLPSI